MIERLQVFERGLNWSGVAPERYSYRRRWAARQAQVGRCLVAVRKIRAQWMSIK